VDWSQNGDLLEKAADSFNAVLTADQSIQFQQNLAKLPIAVVVLVAGTTASNLYNHSYQKSFAPLRRFNPGP